MSGHSKYKILFTAQYFDNKYIFLLKNMKMILLVYALTMLENSWIFFKIFNCILFLLNIDQNAILTISKPFINLVNRLIYKTFLDRRRKTLPGTVYFKIVNIDATKRIKIDYWLEKQGIKRMWYECYKFMHNPKH